ncbi:uncharacterized protein LOC130824824 [Amaranthus tricolor]|uniref:uncharacterized protein LOC130824804 n=1 Tax=Amaranthus tricolor TaxID=29722 RepID=UPI002583CDF2|nr:uncharacterized protein LOC130824804 [Amaranthus tricolor]XP_057545805.1 uncharacterized protein LOC130824805 [Amaranthus tricolor]XP_057545806.1 uncharacterized protein LOC130824806 [Amaranthus tricolor]XP_057545826.1 uncharacterized protein LOC130824824 [Amaranthus tricolor]
MSSSSGSSRAIENSQPTRCYCGMKIAMMRSWTPKNLGRRFMACKLYDIESGRRGCSFFRWIDADQVEWQRVTIIVLVEANKELRNEVNVLRSRLSRSEYEKSCLVAEFELEEAKAAAKVTGDGFDGWHVGRLKLAKNFSKSQYLALLVVLFLGTLFKIME